MSADSGGSVDPPDPFNLYNVVHRGGMPTLQESTKRNYKTLRHAYFTHSSDFEKYFIISGHEIREFDIFDVEEGLRAISKEGFKTTLRLGSGDILVQTKNIHQINALKATTSFGSNKKPVTVSENGVLNQSQAIIKCKEIMRVKEERIIEQLADQNVIGVQRLKARESGKWIDTSTHILTFKTPTCPAEVKVGYLTVKTEIYIPSPFRCVICQRLGHTKKRCDSNKNKPRCAICGLEEPHGFFFPCYLPKCVNCSGAHPSYSKLCPRFIEEKEVNAIRVSLRIPYNLAREELRKRKGPQTSPLPPTPTPGPSKASFSEIVANSTQTHSKSSDNPSRPQKTQFVPVNRSQTQSRVSKVTNKSFKRAISNEKLNNSIIVELKNSIKNKNTSNKISTNTQNKENTHQISLISPNISTQQSIVTDSLQVMPAELPVQTLSSSTPTLSTPPITSSSPSIPWGVNYLPSPCPSPSGPDPDPPDIIVSDDESMPINQNFNSH